MTLGETVVYCSLESVFFSGTVSILCVPSAFGVRAGFDVNTSHACLRAVLAVITLVGGGSGEEGAETVTFFHWKRP